MINKTIKIGTRGSQLALYQANWVKTALMDAHPGLCVDIVIIKTKGDKILDVPLAKVGGKGLFVKEIEEALLNGSVDVAVHSMKDMPSEIPEGLDIGAVPVREIPNDVFLSSGGIALPDLPKGATIGTSSLRRSAQLRALRPDLNIVALRGNIDTRIKKLKDGQMDAIILAAAGIKRLNIDIEITEFIAPDRMLPAVGQGALCIETRANDPQVCPLVSTLDDYKTRVAVLAERAFLHRLEGGCQVPIGAYGELIGDEIHLTGLVAELDGSRAIKDMVKGPAKDHKKLGITLAERLLSMGAGEILEKLKTDADQ